MSKRYYKLGEKVWVKSQKKTGVVKSLDAETYTAKVDVKGEVEELKFWDIDKLRTNIVQKHNRVQKDTILFAKVREDAIIPSKNKEDAGYDIYANFEENEVVIEPNEVKLIPTGIASSVLDKYVLLAKERGSTGTKGMSLRCGVIDSGYRSEIFVPINNTNNKKIVISKDESLTSDDEKIVYPYKKAIAQLLLLPVPDVNVKEIPFEDLQKIPSKRGNGSLGSSGK